MFSIKKKDTSLFLDPKSVLSWPHPKDWGILFTNKDAVLGVPDVCRPNLFITATWVDDSERFIDLQTLGLNTAHVLQSLQRDIALYIIWTSKHVVDG